MLAAEQHNRPRHKQHKISKRQNARMQLAAALIEADNDDLERRRQEALSRQPAQDDHQDDIGPRPPPPPQLRLASQSVLFAPWRDDYNDGENDEDQETHSIAASSALRYAPSRVRSIQRPQSRDFLGVTLPGEPNPSSSRNTAAHSRASSLLSTAALSQQYSTRRDSRRLSTASRLSRTTSRPETPLSVGSRSRAVSVLSNREADDNDSQDAHSRLGEWGMDKFLSTEARDEIARDRDRQRAQSAAGFNTHTRTDSKASAHSLTDVPDVPTDTPRHRATSDIVSVTRPTKGTNLELLARIKLYRERQENLPPDQWGERVPLSQAIESEQHQPRQESTSRAPTPTQAAPTETPTQAQFAFPTTDAATDEQTQPPTPTAGLQLALGSPIQTPDAEHATRQGSVPSHQATTLTASADLNRRESSKGYFGESWSDAGSMWSHGGAQDALSVTRGRNFSTTKPSSAIGHLDPTVEEDTVPDSAIDDDDDDDDVPLGMAGVGSYLRSHSRKNSMLDQSPLPTFARIEPQEGPSTTRSSGNTSPSTEYKPLRPSPLAQAATTDSISTMRGRTQPGPGNFQATAALQGDLYAALALGSSPYPGSTFFTTGRHSPGPGAFHHSPTFDQLPLGSPYMAAGFGLAPPNRLSQLPPSASAMSFSPAQGLSSPPSPELGYNMPTTPTMSSLAMPSEGMTTRQLQALARQSQFPDSYGIITPFLMEEAVHEEKHRRQREQAQAAGLMLPDFASETDDNASLASLPKDGWVPEPQRGLFSRALRPVGGLLGGTPAVDKLKADLAKLEPDLSSARWGQHKRRYSTGAFKPFGAKKLKEEPSAAPSIREPDVGATGYEPELEQSLQMQASDAVSERVQVEEVDTIGTPMLGVVEAAEPDIDDDYVSPPRKGPLKPRGVDARLPETLIMPELLEGSARQPRTRLTEPETDAAEASIPGHGRRQSGLYVPEGFILHDGKALPPIQKVTTAGGKTRLSFVFPAAAPDGIGRRAKMSSTALFRNQLVQHEEEQEGWGWEKSTAPVLQDSDEEAGAEPVKLTKKQIQRAKKTATKEAKIRYKRKRARAIRRKTRAQAQAEGRSNAELGVPDDSPDEDLSLTEDSVGYTSSEEEDGDWDSDDNKRWVDNQKPVGKLFGKSLMDVAEERQAQRQANRRYYGQLEVTEQEAFERASAGQGGDAQSVMAPSEAGGRTFRDNPLGYNDTRERMQAAFGFDRNLARELEDKRKRDAQAAEEADLRRLAQEEYEKEEAERKRRKEEKRNARRIFLKKKTPKQVDGDANSQNVSESASFRGPQDLASASASQVDIAAIENAQLTGQADSVPDSPPIQRAPLEAPRLDLGLSDDGGHANGRKGRKGDATGAAAQWFAPSSGTSSESESDSEDEASRRKRAMQRARLSRSLGGPGMGRLDLAGTALARGESDKSSSEDEVPLSQLKRRPLTQVTTNKKAPKAFADSSDDEEGRMTLDQIKRRSLLARNGMSSYTAPLSSNLAAVAASDSDEEMPLTQLKAKQNKARQSIGTTLDLTYSHTNDGNKVSADSVATPDDSDEDQPIGMRLDADALAALKKHGREDDDSDEDQPIAMRHGVDVLAAIKAQHAAAHGARCACGRLK